MSNSISVVSDRAARLDVYSEPREAAEVALPPGLFARPHDWRRPRPGGDHTTDPGTQLAPAGTLARPVLSWHVLLGRPFWRGRPVWSPIVQGSMVHAVQLVRLGQIV